MNGNAQHWWQTRTMRIIVLLIVALPLLWPAIPPLVDLPGHMGRYRVQLDGGTTVLRQFYDFQWALIGNLGVDLLIVPVERLFGLELGVKLICIAIPVMTAAALLWIAREVHGRIPPTALFALPLVYGHPFLFGFVNFALSMALALLAFALWLNLARLGRLRLRAALFLPISIILWICHTYGWGLLGVLAFSAEVIRRRDQGAPWWRAVFDAVLACVPMGVPVILMILWRSGAVAGGTGDWFNWNAKLMWLNMTLRDRWRWYDAASLFVLFMLLFFALRDRRLEFSRNLGVSALFLTAVFILLPRIVFGSAYADMRLTPYMIAIAIVGIRPKHEASPRFLATMAGLGLAFFAIRMATQTASFAIAANDYERALPALDHVPEGARLASFVGYNCAFTWVTNRMEHLPALATVRRRAFSNDQWDMAGAQLLRVDDFGAGYFKADPSQMVTGDVCPTDKWRSLDWSLANLPRGAFDYVWLIAPPRFDPKGLRGMTPVWQNGRDRLYRIDDRTMEPRP
jgi:hypothetical protein